MLDLVAAAKFHSNKVSSEAQISVRVLRNEVKKKRRRKSEGLMCQRMKDQQVAARRRT